MPTTPVAAATATVTAGSSGFAPVAVTATVGTGGLVEPGFVEGGFVAAAAGLPEIPATVSRRYVDAYDGPLVAVGLRVQLAGAWVPEADLAGPVTWRAALDTHRRAVTVPLAGRAYSVFTTLDTWTPVPLELWTDQGDPLDPPLVSRLVFRGWVLPGTRQQTRGGQVTVTLQADDAWPYDRVKLCHEIPPGSGLTRGDIVRLIAADAGLPAADVPEGAVYQRPLFADGQTLFAFLRDFGQPEGWSWSLEPQPDGDGHVLTARTPELKRPPLPPDHVWTLAHVDPDGIAPEAPAAPPSRWVVRGYASLTRGEGGGQVVETETVDLEDLYAPREAVEQQAADGTLTPTGRTGGIECLRTVRRLTTERTTVDGREVLEVVREWGWFNPSAARLEVRATAGPVDGYHYAQAYVDQEGHFVAWVRERFVQIGERRTATTYDAAGQVAETRVQEFRWHRRPRGVRQAGSPAPTFVGTGIADDDASYATFANNSVETYGLAQETTTRPHRNPAGAVEREERDVWGWYSRGAAVDLADTWIRHDGRGQEDAKVRWQRTHQPSTTYYLTADQRIAGKAETERGWRARRAPGGSHDWGDFRSYDVGESFATTKQTLTRYRVRGDGTVEETTFSSDQDAVPGQRLVGGRLELPDFEISDWTAWRQQPVEAVLDDPTLEALFGGGSEVLLLDHVQSVDEARAVARRLRRQATARRVLVRRPETWCQLGDTVLLVDPTQGLAHRALLVAEEVQRDLATPAASAVYTLEVPL